MTIPKELPRFAESFRAFIDHPDCDTRMLTSEWMHDAEFLRFRLDFCPKLDKAGRIGFIASTVPALWHGREVAYYGTKNPPIVIWWWKDGEWQAQHSREAIAAYCAHKGVPVQLFDVPRSTEWRR